MTQEQATQPSPVPRYLPQRPLPAYRHLPGRTPHPSRDPRGHSWQPGPEPAPCGLPAARWAHDPSYLYGVDLYNTGYYWEAHESWESCWRGCRNDPLAADHLQGLIQVATGWLRRRMGSHAAARRIAERGIERLERVAVQHRFFMGVELAGWLASVRQQLDKPDSMPPLLRLELGSTRKAQSEPDDSRR